MSSLTMALGRLTKITQEGYCKKLEWGQNLLIARIWLALWIYRRLTIWNSQVGRRVHMPTKILWEEGSQGRQYFVLYIVMARMLTIVSVNTTYMKIKMFSFLMVCSKSEIELKQLFSINSSNLVRVIFLSCYRIHSIHAKFYRADPIIANQWATANN